MNKKIIIAAAIIASIGAFAACSGNEPAVTTEPSSSSSVQTEWDSPSAQTSPSLTIETAPQSTTAAPTVTDVVTAVKETTKRAVTTTKKPASTTAPSAAPTEPVTIRGKIYTEENFESIKSKYGVVLHRYTTVKYQKKLDGSKHIVSTEVEDNYNSLRYSATYSELLPAAKENREKYRNYINEVLRIINSYRAEKGVAPLTLREDLTVMSCVRAEEIAWSGKFSHTRPNGKSGTSVFIEIGIEKGVAGENLGRHFMTPEAVCIAWKNSKKHYAILMDPRFVSTGIGIAAYPDTSEGLSWTQHFYSEP